MVHALLKLLVGLAGLAGLGACAADFQPRCGANSECPDAQVCVTRYAVCVPRADGGVDGG